MGSDTHFETRGNRGGERRPPRALGRGDQRHLFKHWPQVARRLWAAKQVALFLDFDGTLVPIQSRLKHLHLKPSTRQLLRRLARHPSVALYVISGRRRADVRKRVNVPGASYLGLHGWEQNGTRLSTVATRRFIAFARRLLSKKLAGLPNIRISDKGVTFDVHYRGASPATTRKARAALHEVLDPLMPEVHVLHGKKIWEVLPLEIQGKGAAVQALLAKSPALVLPIYVGDDTPDESAFKALPHGITVRVGRPRRTWARFELRNPQEVARFLNKMEAEIA